MNVALLGALAAAALLGGCADADDEQAGTAATEHCAAVELPDLQGGQHLIGDREPPADYSSTPPTSGWHVSGAFELTVRDEDDPLSEPEQVSVLEAGGVVVTYRELADDERSALEQHVRAEHAGRVAVTPYEQLSPGQTAFTAWGAVQRCGQLDLDALDTFVAEYADDDPAVPGRH